MTAGTVPTETQNTLSTRLSRLSQAARRSGPAFKDFFLQALVQWRILKKPFPGIMHKLIFWGVTVQILGTLINVMNMKMFVPLVVITFPRGNFYLGYELIMDLAGLAILIGVAMAAFRRYIQRPKTLETRWDDTYALVLLALIPIAGFTLEASRLVATNPPWAGWSPIGNIVANLMRAMGMTPQGAAALHNVMFWVHMVLGFALVASIPFTKLRHLIYTPLNVILHPRRKEGVLSKIENIDEAEILGVGQVEQFEPHQLLSFDACVRCGRCEETCPAAISGMPYSPRMFIQSLREAMLTSLVQPNGKSAHELLGETLPEETPWYCTTCGACLTRCPAFVNPVDEIIDLRRYQALTTGNVPRSVGDALRNIERQGNPWGMPGQDRIAWAQGLQVRELGPGDETDVLLFLGCAFAFDDRNKKVAQSFARVLQKAGVDFGILGLDESCCGETARRLGNEYLFQVMAEQNIATLSQVKFNRIVTQCPHCFNTLKNEYPQFGGDYKVQHYTEYLAELSLPWNSASPNGNGVHGQVAYHDSCYLGRYNQIYSQPRNLLKQAKVNTVEMARRNDNSFCCGGGGGQMWLESDANTRINHRRLGDALDVQADVVATACPYCLLMFDDAIRSKGIGEKVQVLDIAEVIAKQLEV